MRNKRLITLHRGGQLTQEEKRQLMRWAILCSEHAATNLHIVLDKRLMGVLQVAEGWVIEQNTTGDAMKASQLAHSIARELTNNVEVAVARSIGHSVATAHMADHSVGAALYALKAIQLIGGSVYEEMNWQMAHLPGLPDDLIDLIRESLLMRAKAFKIG